MCFINRKWWHYTTIVSSVLSLTNLCVALCGDTLTLASCCDIVRVKHQVSHSGKHSNRFMLWTVLVLLLWPARHDLHNWSKGTDTVSAWLCLLVKPCQSINYAFISCPEYIPFHLWLFLQSNPGHYFVFSFFNTQLSCSNYLSFLSFSSEVLALYFHVALIDLQICWFSLC